MKKINNLIENVGNGEEYREKIRGCRFVANMTRNKKMFHKVGDEACYQSQSLYNFIKFDSIEEALAFEPRLSFCQKCFPTKQS